MRQMVPTKESITTARDALEAETQEVVQVSNRLNDNLAKAGKKIWRQVLVIWAVGIVLAISYFLVLNYTPISSDQTPPRTGEPTGYRGKCGNRQSCGILSTFFKGNSGFSCGSGPGRLDQVAQSNSGSPIKERYPFVHGGLFSGFTRLKAKKRDDAKYLEKIYIS